MLDPTFPALHVRPDRGWLNDPNGLCRIDGRYHVFFQHNPDTPVHARVGWGHASSADLLRWDYHPLALAPRAGEIDAMGCWSGCITDDRGVPTALYTAVRDHAWNGVAVLARGDRELLTWDQDTEPVMGVPERPEIEEVRDPFVFRHQGRRYAVQGAGRRGGRPELLLYGCDDLERWTELGALLTDDDPVAHEVAPAEVWECPNLFELDGRWVLLVSLLHWPAGEAELAGVRYLVGDLVAEGDGLRFAVESGGVLDGGPAFYAPQVLVDGSRVLLWGWAWELDRSPEQVAEAGWAGSLTFPRELSLRDGVLQAYPAAELIGLRAEALGSDLAEALTGQAWELVATGALRVSLAEGSERTPVAEVTGTPDQPARVLVDGSVVEVFQGGDSHTTRAYPTGSRTWRVDADPGTLTCYRLGPPA